MPKRKTAFSLVELMVVILIIGILVGILIPVVTKVRTKGYAASTLAQLNAIRSAMEAYQGTFSAYPGPIPDHFMYLVDPGTPPLPAGLIAAGSGARMTMGENGVLGLMGGLRDDSGTITYHPEDVGVGPRNLHASNPGQHSPFYTNTRDLTKDFFMDVGKNSPSCFDTNIPEFVDRFTEPLPILYLRARRGARGVMSDMKNYNAVNPPDLLQYDLRQYAGYISDFNGGTPSGAIVIGGKYQAGNGKDPKSSSNPKANQGLWDLGDARGMTDQFDANNANYAIPYFKHPSLNPPGTQNIDGTPRSKDGFILISAGADRIFGTSDDLTTFGNVGGE